MANNDQITMERPGACHYEFEVKRKRGDRARLVIHCRMPSGLFSRMDVEEEDLSEFVRGFVGAVKEITGYPEPSEEQLYLSV